VLLVGLHTLNDLLNLFFVVQLLRPWTLQNMLLMHATILIAEPAIVLEVFIVDFVQAILVVALVLLASCMNPVAAIFALDPSFIVDVFVLEVDLLAVHAIMPLVVRV